MTSMDRCNRYHDAAARNPQRPAAYDCCGRPARADEGNDAGSGAVFRLSTEKRTNLALKLTHYRRLGFGGNCRF